MRQPCGTARWDRIRPGRKPLFLWESLSSSLHSIIPYKASTKQPSLPDSNTTLPHPSADTSPNACIESADVNISRTHSRHSSFQLRNNRPKAKGSLASGLISPTNGLPDGIPWADGSTERKDADQPPRSATVATGQPKGRSERDESEDQRVERGREGQGYQEVERKKGLLRKLPLHKA